MKERKCVLLLGGFGFIGTNLLKYIDNNFQDEFSVVVFDRFEKHPHDIHFNCVEKVYVGDFSDDTTIEFIFKNHSFDLVIHSISTTIPLSSKNARYDIETNLIPTVNLLNTMTQYGIKDIIFISSGGAVYGNNINKTRHKESDDLFPVSSYGIVKLTIEKYLIQYANIHQIRPLILRLSNPYGPYHFSVKQGLCNVAIRSAVQNIPFYVWGNGETKKDYIYIDDFCDIFFQLFFQKVNKQILNIGSGDIYSVNTILKKVKNFIPKFEWKYSDASTFDVDNVELEINNLKTHIGNYQFTPFDTGLQLTFDWITKSKKINE